MFTLAAAALVRVPNTTENRCERPRTKWTTLEYVFSDVLIDREDLTVIRIGFYTLGLHTLYEIRKTVS